MPAGDNDSERFKTLYVAYSGQVFAYALRRLRNPDTAADVMAEVFTVAWRKLNAVPNDDSAKLWLFGVARNVVRNQERGIRRRTNLAVKLVAHFSGIDYEPDPAPEPELVELVRVALGELKDDERELVQLVMWDSLTPSQAAQVVGMPPGTARTKLHKARMKLRTALMAQAPERFFENGHVYSGETVSLSDTYKEEQ
ncbi:MAG: RNA polymerase sigma factor [Actinobacteria bacterium]|nr:RNA polymerase sigma factor [Actinomycetota bacterium]